jgi:hypothetical protein
MICVKKIMGLATIAYYRRRILASPIDALTLGILPASAAAFLIWVLVRAVQAAPASQNWSLLGVKPIPASWATPSLVTGSCATGSDYYVETDGSSAGSYYGPVIETTSDDGITWTSSPMYPPDQSEIGIYLSCPVPGGCVAVAGDSTEQSMTWVVLSSLPNAGYLRKTG